MPLLRVNGFLPSGVAWLVVAVPCFLLATLLFSIPASNVDPEEVDLGGRIRFLEGKVDQLRQLDETKRSAFLSLKTEIDVMARLTERTNMTLLDLATRGNRSLQKMLWYNLTHASNAAPIQLPKVFDFLPHLLYHNLSVLQPALKISRTRKDVDLLIAIPTVKRPKVSYLLNTLRSLFDNLEALEREKVVIIVMIAEQGLTQFAQEQVAFIRQEFSPELEQGLLEVVVPPAAFYPPDLESISPTFNDPPQRMVWRTKQNLDYAYLMMYAQPKGRLYLQLEDDVITKPLFYSKMMAFVAAKSRFSHWLLLEFSSLGFIGKLFRTSDLPLIVNFILMFHREKPVDWLLDHIMYVRYCNPEKSQKDCAAEKAKYRIRHKPSLFQHIGVHSSLAGKTQKLKEKDFGKQVLHRPHVDNPPAHLTTSLKVYQKYTLERAYAGETFFWALSPAAADWLKIELTPPVHLDGIRLRAGNSEHPDDLFAETTVEVLLPGGAVDASKYGQYRRTEDHYLILTSFAATSGLVDISNLTIEEPVSALRLVVHKASSNWVILNEIWLRVKR